ncbi:MupG family TIM beta-alpha barrel fold protein [Staphylococcus simulans]
MDLGFSVYLGEAFDEAYIEKMLNHGFRYIFTSLQIPEDNHELYLTRLKQLAAINAQRAQIIADVNGQTLQKLGLPLNEPEAIRDAGIDIIRLDEAVDITQLADYVEAKHPIMLNASTDAFHILRALSDRAISQENILVAHNYYPRPDTGLDRTFFQHVNERLKGAYPEIQIMAFVPGTQLRGPIYRGLPTLEAHRMYHPLAGAVELEHDLCDIVCIGDSQIDDFLIHQFETYFSLNRVVLRTNLSSDSPYLGIYHNRPDVARDVVRTMEARQTFTEHVSQSHVVERRKGAVTLDNALYGRYMNELQIVRRDLPKDEAVNILGYVDEQDLDCIDMIGSNTAFEFVSIEEESHGHE